MYIILALLIAVAIILILRPWERRACRWREDRHALADGRVLHTCQSCGAELALPRGQSPRQCLAGRHGS